MNCITSLVTESYQALSVLTVSDHILTGEATSSEERQTTFLDMMKVALDAAIQE